MGIIQKQGLRSSIFLIAGFAIGGINLLFLFPQFFSQEEIGLTRALIDSATVLSVLATAGSIPVIYKFHPFYTAHLKRKEIDLPAISLVFCIAGFILICLAGYIFKDFIIRKLGKSPLFADNFLLVYPFTFLMLMFTWMEAFGWALKKTVSTNFLKETLVRILTTLLILLTGYSIISKSVFIDLFSILYLLPVLILAGVLINTGQWHFQFKISTVTRRFKKKMLTFGMFVFGATFLNIASRTVDSFMIIGLKGLAETAVFTYAAYLVAFMDLPLRSINSIATPVISESWKERNFANIEMIYRKSTLTLLIAGLFVFMMVALNLDNLVLFLGNKWAGVKIVVLIMGVAKLVDLGAGVNGQIIATSSNWRFDFYTNVLLTLMAFPLNFFLIKQFGILGAAYSNLAALSIFNLVRFIFLYKKYKWQPYGLPHLKLILTSLVIFVAVYAIPFMYNIYVDAVFRSVLFAGIFVPAMLRMKISDDFNSSMSGIMRKMRLQRSRRSQ